MIQGAIAIFVKTPGFSPVKTRLAKNLGKETAELFYRAAAQSVAAVTQRLSEQARVQSYYAVAEQSALNCVQWQDFPCIWQGEGGLGERMAYIYQTLLEKHDFVLLVGADIPQMTVSELYKGVTWLTNYKSRLVLGPSLDGGFWIFGGNCPISMQAWIEVRYSQSDTGAQFLNNINVFGDLKKLATLRDVDESSDLLPLRDALLNLAEPLPEQYELIHFLDALPHHFY